MSTALRVRGVIAGVVLALVGLTGCVQVPLSGPIKRVDGQAETCQNCINVEVVPPAPGADPVQVVNGYLRASWYYQPGYATAKQFLTGAAANSWRPDAGVWIYEDDKKAVRGNEVRLDARLLGRIEADRTFTAKDEPLGWDFGLVQENGEWRIGRPPPGLLVTKFAFDSFYSGYSTYFVGNTTSLVPERVYIPTLRNPANVASALMNALLDGPSSWLSPAVGTAVPMGTSLSVSSVPIANAVAEVPLNDAVLALPDPERALLFAQIAYTLRQVPAIKGVQITVDGQRLRLPGGDPSGVVSVETLSRELDPVPYVTDKLYAVRDGVVYRVPDPTDSAELEPIPGLLGQKERVSKVSSLALSVNGTDLAVVTDGGTVLRRVDTATGNLTRLTDGTGLSRLLRPQFTRYNEIWAIGRRDGQQQFWLSSLEQDTVQTSGLSGRGITAFRISPDGTRMALVRRTATGSELGLARIVRGARVRVEGWKRIPVIRAEDRPITQIADVAWLDATDLLVLGTTTTGEAPVALRVAADASKVTEEGGEPSDWAPSELTVLSRPQTILLTDPGEQTWRRNGDQWAPLLPDVSQLAYAG